MGDDKSMDETSIGKEELKKILREFKSESDVVKLEQRARYALKQVDRRTLSIAEQELLEEGFSQEDLRKLCDIHLQLLGENLENQGEVESSLFRATKEYPLGLFCKSRP